MGFKVTGKGTFEGNLRRIRQRFPYESGKAIIEELQEVEFPETQALVPVDTGDLKSTGHVTEAEVRGNTATAGIAYGDADVDYALVVHEDMEANHPNGGQAKYVSQPLEESAPYMAERLAARMRFERWAK